MPEESHMNVILQGVPGIIHGYIDDILVTGEMSVDQLVLCQQITAEYAWP